MKIEGFKMVTYANDMMILVTGKHLRKTSIVMESMYNGERRRTAWV